MATRGAPKRPTRAWVAIERAVLGVGMSFVAWVIERQLVKAIRKGSVERAPRTAANVEAGQPSVSVHPQGDGRPAS
jgi:hypothetical protein